MRQVERMKLITLSGWSLAVSALALLVAVGVAGYTRNQYNLTSEQAQRVLAVKKPVLDIASQPIDGRHWNLSVMITNRSDERILPVGLSIPKPEGGFLTMAQTQPEGPPVASSQINNTQRSEFRGRPIPAGATDVWAASYEIADAFPAKPSTAITIRAVIKYLGAQERTEAIAVSRKLD
jgi:hypothetical protein